MMAEACGSWHEAASSRSAQEVLLLVDCDRRVQDLAQAQEARPSSTFSW